MRFIIKHENQFMTGCLTEPFFTPVQIVSVRSENYGVAGLPHNEFLLKKTTGMNQNSAHR